MISKVEKLQRAQTYASKLKDWQAANDDFERVTGEKVLEDVRREISLELAQVNSEIREIQNPVEPVAGARPEPISKEAARDELASVISAAFSSAVEQRPARVEHWQEVGYNSKSYTRQEESNLIRISAGGGKTHATILEAVKTLQETPGFRLLWRAKDHAMAKEVLEKFRKALADAGMPEALAQVWHGMTAADPRESLEGESACRDLDRVALVTSAGGNAATACSGCPFNVQKGANNDSISHCYYQAQRARIYSASILIAVGDESLTRLPAPLRRQATKNEQGDKERWAPDFDIVILDETTPQAFLSKSYHEITILDGHLIEHEYARVMGSLPDLPDHQGRKHDYSAAKGLLDTLRDLYEVSFRTDHTVTPGDLLDRGIDADALETIKAWVTKHRIAVDEKMLTLPPDECAAILTAAGGVNSLCSGVSATIAALLQGMDDYEHKHADRGAPLAQVCHNTRYVRIDGKSTPRPCVDIMKRSAFSPHILTAPQLLLDATADESLLGQFFPRMNLAADLIVEDGAGVNRVQVYDSMFSHKTIVAPIWRDDEKPVTDQEATAISTRLRGRQKSDLVNAQDLADFDRKHKHRRIKTANNWIDSFAALHDFCKAVYGGRVGIVSPSKVETLLHERGVSSDDTLHFNKVRGQNELENCRTLIVVGRTSPAVAEAERMAAVIYGYPVTRSRTGRFDIVDVEIRTRNGTKMPTGKAERHCDWRVERVRRSICESELVQAIGRSRSVNRDEDDPVLEIILTNVPLDEYRPDYLLTTADLKGLAGWPGATLAGGLMPLIGEPGAKNSDKGAYPAVAHLWRDVCAQMPGFAAAAKLAEKRDVVQSIKDTLRASKVATNGDDPDEALSLRDQLKYFQDQALAGGDVLFFGLPVNTDRIALGELTVPDARYSVPTLRIEGEGTAGSSEAILTSSGAEWVRDASKRGENPYWSNRDAHSGIFLSNDSYKANPTVRDAAGPISGPISNLHISDTIEQGAGRHETVLACLSEFRMVPLNKTHASNLARHIWETRGQAKNPLSNLKPVDGEIEVAYMWKIGARASKGRAIVRADNMQEAIEILQRAMPGAEILDAEMPAAQAQEPAHEDSGRPGSVEQCFAGFGCVSSSPEHCAAYAGHIWETPDSAKDHVQRIKPAEGEFQVHYRWAAPGGRRRLSYAIVRAGTLEEARAKLLAALTGAEIVRKPSGAR